VPASARPCPGPFHNVMVFRVPMARPVQGLRICLGVALLGAVLAKGAGPGKVYLELLNKGQSYMRRAHESEVPLADGGHGAPDGSPATAPVPRRGTVPQVLAPEAPGVPGLPGVRRPANDSSTTEDPSRFIVVSNSNDTFASEQLGKQPHVRPPVLGGPATQGLRCVNCLLAVSACVLIYFARVRPCSAGAGGLRSGVLGIESGFQIAIFLAYVAFSCTHMFLQRRAGATGYSVVSATIVIYALKCLCALCMYIAKGGRGFYALLEPTGGARFGRIPTCMLTLLPGGCLGCYDALSFLSLSALDPVTYQIVLHMRLVFIALLWQFTFRRQLTSTQWFALLLFAVASTTKGIEQIRDFGPDVHRGLHIALFQILMAVFGNVMTECLLKEVPVATDLLNTCLYFQGLVVLLVVVCVTNGGPSAVHSTLLAPRAWKELISDPWMISSIVCMVMFGIVTAYFLRELSNLLKELSACFVIVASAFVEWVLLGASSCTMLGLQAVALAILAVGVYNAEPLESRKSPGGGGRPRAR